MNVLRRRARRDLEKGSISSIVPVGPNKVQVSLSRSCPRPFCTYSSRRSHSYHSSNDRRDRHGSTAMEGKNCDRRRVAGRIIVALSGVDPRIEPNRKESSVRLARPFLL